MNQRFITLTKTKTFLLEKEAKASLNPPKNLYLLFRKKKQKGKHTSLI